MKAKELQRILGMGETWFQLRRKRGDFKRFEVEPLSPGREKQQARYSRRLVELYLVKESITRYGKGARTA